MRRPIAVLTLMAGLAAASAALAQGPSDPRGTPAGRSVTATGQTKPPPPGQPATSSQQQMLKAQHAAQARDKAWDSKMNKTMGSICKGC